MNDLQALFDETLGRELRTRRSEALASAAKHSAARAEARAIAAEAKAEAAEAKLKAVEARVVHMNTERQVLRDILLTSVRDVKVGSVRQGLRDINYGIQEYLSDDNAKMFLPMTLMVRRYGSSAPEPINVRGYWYVRVLKKLVEARLATSMNGARLLYKGHEMHDGLLISDYIEHMPGDGGPLHIELELERI